MILIPCNVLINHQVSPSELEGLLIKHPLVSDVGVTSIPDEQAGELPRAYIVREAETLTEKQVQDYISGRIMSYLNLVSSGTLHFKQNRFFKKNLSVVPTITMTPQENPEMVRRGLRGNSTKEFILKNLYC